MKIKNIEVGSYIQSKKDSKQLIAGHCYQVAEKDVSDKTVRLFSVDDSFDDSLWFCVSDFRKPKPLLKQLDQSVFDGLSGRWQFAAVDKSGEAWIYTGKPVREAAYWHVMNYVMDHIASSASTGYDTTDWQNSLIERKELTGSDLCRAMLARGDKYVMCMTSSGVDIIDNLDCPLSSTCPFIGYLDTYSHAVPINNRGEPLTASEVGL